MMERVRRLKAEGRFAEVCAETPYTRFVGLEVIQQGDEVLTLLRQRHSNVGNTTIPAIHGGVVGALLEHAAIVEALWRFDLDVHPKIVNLTVDFLRPCLLADTFARGTLIKQGRRIANIRVEAWQSDPTKLVATANTHFLLS